MSKRNVRDDERTQQAEVRRDLETFGVRLEAAPRPELEPVNAVGERASGPDHLTSIFTIRRKRTLT